MSKLIRDELLWWFDFATNLNGECFCEMGRVWPVLTLSTDASLSGFGAIMNEHWLAGSWNPKKLPPVSFRQNWVPSPELHESLVQNISFLELVAACVPLLAWGPLLSGFKVIVLSDDTQTVAFLNRGTTKNLAALQWLKKVFYSSITHGYRFTAVHSPGVQNVLADSLSRLTGSDNASKKFFDHFMYPLPGRSLSTSAFCSCTHKET